MAQILRAIGGTIFLVLGTLHGVLTLRDVAKPRAFTPTDAVRIAMQGARLAFNPGANLWQSLLSIQAAVLLTLKSVPNNALHPTALPGRSEGKAAAEGGRSATSSVRTTTLGQLPACGPECQASRCGPTVPPSLR
jgi:hypothetical protein